MFWDACGGRGDGVRRGRYGRSAGSSGVSCVFVVVGNDEEEVVAVSGWGVGSDDVEAASLTSPIVFSEVRGWANDASAVGIKEDIDDADDVEVDEGGDAEESGIAGETAEELISEKVVVVVGADVGSVIFSSAVRIEVLFSTYAFKHRGRDEGVEAELEAEGVVILCVLRDGVVLNGSLGIANDMAASSTGSMLGGGRESKGGEEEIEPS